MATSRAPARPEVPNFLCFHRRAWIRGARAPPPGRKWPSGRECPGRRRSGRLLGRASGSLQATLDRADREFPPSALRYQEIAASPARTIKIEGASPPVVQGRAAPARMYRPSPPEGRQRWIARSTSDGRRGPQRCTGALRIGNPARLVQDLCPTLARSAQCPRTSGTRTSSDCGPPSACEVRGSVITTVPPFSQSWARSSRPASEPRSRIFRTATRSPPRRRRRPARGSPWTAASSD